MISSFILFLFVATIIGLIVYQSKPERVFGALFLILYTFEFVTTEQVLSSFSNQGLLTLVLLMLCSLALEKTKLLKLVTRHVIKPDYCSTWLRLFGFTALSSAFLNNTAVVSTMLAPIRNNNYHKASKLLLPLSYAAILGGTLTLVGTSTNLIVNSMVIEAGLPALGFFDFTLIGICLVISCGTLLFVLSSWLPDKENIRKQAKDYFISSKVDVNSSMIGKSIEENGLRNLESLFLVEIVRAGHLISPVSPHAIIQADDELIFSGDIKKVTLLSQFDGLSTFASSSGLTVANLTEVVVRPDSVLVGNTLKSAGFRALFDAAVVAIKRDGESVSGKLGELSLKAGDYLVLAVGEDFSSRHNINKNFFVISGVNTDHRLDGFKEKIAILGFGLALGLSAFSVIPLFKSMLILLGVLLFTGCLKVNEVLQRLPKQIWIIITSALLLSQALSNADVLAGLSSLLQNNDIVLSPLIALIIVYLLTWLLTELVTNNAAAAMVFPIAFGLAEMLNVNVYAFILAVAFGASASFMSPYGYQTNLMIFNAGQYRLNDFIKIGFPMALMYGVVAICSIYFFIGIH